MYQKSDVIAVIVSYNPDKTIIENVQSLKRQVNEVLVIDNNSNNNSNTVLSYLSSIEGCQVLHHEQNEGIGKRLNEAVQIAKDRRYILLLTMDQDTVLDSHCVQSMIDVLNRDERIASVGPARKRMKLRTDYFYKNYLITSGNLLKVESIIEAGGYWEQLFVDMVDIDMSLALRRNKFKLAISNKASMRHYVGNDEKSRFLGMDFSYRTHNPNRFYYIFRNLCLINRTYFFSFPVFCIKLDITHLKHFLHILVEKDRRKKYRELFKGIHDGLLSQEKRKRTWTN